MNKYKDAYKMITEVAPVDLKDYVEKMKTQEMDLLRRELEGIAERAAFLAGYLDERHGYGCGDQGHDKAVKTANKNGRKVWVQVFGYNAYHDIRF
jgi:hypothetical protein